MPTYQTTRRVPFSAAHMFDVVADIERYPEFLPMCEALNIKEQSTKDNETLLIADMTVAYKAVRETFESNVTLAKNRHRITSKSFNGPFKHLLSHWDFEPLSDNQCDIHYSIDYEFKNWMLQKLIGTLFEKAVSTYAESFEQRAATLLRGIKGV